MKKLWITLGVIVGLGLIIFFVAGYFLGNVPVASKLLGTNKPKDLGVIISTKGAYSAFDKMNTPATAKELDAVLKNPESYTKVKTTLTQDEASSILALGKIPDFPLRLTQIKFGPGGDIQAAGVLDIAELRSFLDDVGASGDTVNKVMGYAKNLKYMNYYFEGNCSVVNNLISLQVESVKLGNISLPESLTGEAGSLSRRISNTLTSNGYNIRKLAISEGKVELDYDRPLGSLYQWMNFVQY
jgi:hypothetical protein